MLCTCPVGSAFSDIVFTSCPSDFGQLQKVIFTRKFSAAGVLNKVTTTSILLLATWTPLLAAADGTKVQCSPWIQNPTTEPGAKKEFGGGNATLDGIPIIVGSEPTTFTGTLLRNAQSTIALLKPLMCEEMAVYLIDEHGKIAGSLDGTDVYPFPIYNLFIGDKKLGGFDEPDSNVISWSFKPNWSDAFAMYTPTDFDALTELPN